MIPGGRLQVIIGFVCGGTRLWGLVWLQSSFRIRGKGVEVVVGIYFLGGDAH